MWMKNRVYSHFFQRRNKIMCSVSFTIHHYLFECVKNNLCIQAVKDLASLCGCVNTVNLEIFARVLFSRNFAYAKIKPQEMPKSLSRLLIKVYLALVADF